MDALKNGLMCGRILDALAEGPKSVRTLYRELGGPWVTRQNVYEACLYLAEDKRIQRSNRNRVIVWEIIATGGPE